MRPRWEGVEERPLRGIRRLRLTSVSVLGLATVSTTACSIMVIKGGSPLLYIFAWLPLVSYLYLSGVWAMALPGYVVWREFTLDRVWARFWMDDGNLGLELETRMRVDLIPFKAEYRWSYAVHYLLPEGLSVGVIRLFNDRSSERIMLLVEGVDEGNWDLAQEVLLTLDCLDIGQVTIYGQPACARVPWGYTTRA